MAYFRTAKEGMMTDDILSHRVTSQFVVNENLEGIPFGRVVAKRKDDDTIVLIGQGGNDLNNSIVLGISIQKEKTPKCEGEISQYYTQKKIGDLYANPETADFWRAKEAISILENGTIWIKVFEDVNEGDDVYFAKDNFDRDTFKLYGSFGASGEKLEGAKYLTSAKAGEFAKVRINK